jgi:TRAP-type mannitol/chloroaromatic compound transport system substrate-binding protein
MRKLSCISTAFVCAAAMMAVSGCGNSGNGQQAASSGATPSSPAQTVTLKIASAFPTSPALVGEGAVTFAARIDRVSGGTLETKIFEPGALVPALEAIQAVSKGSADAVK